jgi:hypothetical protein
MNLKSNNMDKYDELYKKLVNEKITTHEMQLLNHLAFGTTFMNSNDKGTKKTYTN